MSSNVTHAKEPLFRMVKRDANSSEKSVDDPCGCFSFIFGYGRCRDHDART